MTGILKDLMHERADSLDAPDLDIDAIIRDGDQRRGRRFQVAAGGLVAASLVMAAAVAVPQLRTGGDGDRDAAASVHSYDVAYAVDGTVHDGPRTIETGVRIAGLVQGVSGYVVADEQGRVHTVIDGVTSQVGLLAEADRRRLEADDDVVAWVDAADGGTLSVLDLATGDRADVAISDWPGEAMPDTPGIPGDGAEIAAVDGRTVYVTDTRGVMAWGALDGEEPVLIPAPDDMDVEVRDVQDGQILHVVRTFEPEERDGGTTFVEVAQQRIGRDLEDGRPVPGVGGVLSPDGRRLAFMESDSVDGPTGLTASSTSVGDADGDAWTPVTAADRYDSVVVYRWLDADTFAATGASLGEKSFRSELLSCEATTGVCTTVSGSDDWLVLPTGHLK